MSLPTTSLRSTNFELPSSNSRTQIDTTEALPTQDVVDHEILKRISHGEKALKIEASIMKLRGRKSLIDSEIGHEMTFFEDFKSRFPA